MAKLIVTEFVTLDGVVEAPEKWSLAYWNDAIAEYKHSELFAAGALLLGRVTYEGFAAAWPQRRGADAYAHRMNDLPRFVASRTLTSPRWAGTTVLGDGLAEVPAIKARTAGDLLLFGSNKLAGALLTAGLVDEVRVLSYPVVRGSGARLLDGSTGALDLLESKSLPRGVTLLRFAPAHHVGAQ